MQPAVFAVKQIPGDGNGNTRSDSKGSGPEQIVMELCQGDITKKDHVLWNVTLAEAIEWGEFLVKRRYEWIEIIGRIFGGQEAEGTDKKCRDASICAMCRKTCNQRLQ